LCKGKSLFIGILGSFRHFTTTFLPIEMISISPTITLLESSRWKDYELIDSGDGLKLERFGPFRFVRPEAQALWKPALSSSVWEDVHGIFQPTSEESGGHWKYIKKVDEKWVMQYPLEKVDSVLKFNVMTTPGRHLGVFPETAAHWDWMSSLVKSSGRPVKVLNLFGYTGLSTLAVAAAGASVTHVDASKKSVGWARENQSLSGLDQCPIRWIVDDAMKFVQRESRRGVKYDGLILDPPKFGRGPKGEVWEVYKSLPELLEICQSVISDKPLFVVLTVYAVRASAIHLYYALQESANGWRGKLDAGEMVMREKSADRLLSHAVYARWESSTSGS
jgi:23S rRNA (cytosine1962-C5)-methyltransferase